MSGRRRVATDEALLLVVDAIGADVAREVFDAGLLPEFSAPRPLVSTFPSLTNVAVSALLRAAVTIRPPGYEARWVDPVSWKVRGAVGREADEPGLLPYRGRPDGLLANMIEYTLRDATVRSHLAWITRSWVDERGPSLAYLSATDAIGHFDGRDALVDVFAETCRQVLAARDTYEQRHGVRPAIVMCSDHGMAFGLHDFLGEEDVAAHLTAAGLVRGEPGPSGFQLAPLGEVGAGAVWCDPIRVAEVAERVTELDGVDLVTARVGDDLLVLRRGVGRAWVHVREGRFRYTHDGSDPLELDRYLAGGAATAQELLPATWDAPFPDALVRVHRGHGDLVRWPAPVLFSMAPGWTYGSWLTRQAASWVGQQVGTHGGLGREQSLGFVCASGEGAPFEALARAPAVRAEEVFTGLGDVVIAGSAPTPVLAR